MYKCKTECKIVSSLLEIYSLYSFIKSFALDIVIFTQKLVSLKVIITAVKYVFNFKVNRARACTRVCNVMQQNILDTYLGVSTLFGYNAKLRAHSAVRFAEQSVRN